MVLIPCQHDILKDLTVKIDHNLLIRGVSNVETYHANNFACFTCYFEHYLQMPEHINMGHFKSIKKGISSLGA